MNILMMTNTYTPIVGGVEKSISTFSENLRKEGHKVLIAAPAFKDAPKNEGYVIRLPALQKFNQTDFSVNLPVPGILSKIMKSFHPDIVHSHHPFLMGDLALRLARQYELPLVFTYHTMFEQYLHYLPVHNEQVKRFVIGLSCGYANLTDRVIVPTQSVYDVLKDREVRTPLAIIPTSIDVAAYARGAGQNIRGRFDIPGSAYLIGHVGRLETEKNLEFLSRTVSSFLQSRQDVHFLVVGKGSLTKKIKAQFDAAGVGDRLHLAGVLQGQELIDSYQAMDVFSFSSHSETQGMVLVEAMAAGVPVVAVEAPGARDVIRNEQNGRIISGDDEKAFCKALTWHYQLSEDQKYKLREHTRDSVKNYSHENCVQRLLELYESVEFQARATKHENSVWGHIMNRVKTEWELLKNITGASESALSDKQKKYE